MTRAALLLPLALAACGGSTTAAPPPTTPPPGPIEVASVDAGVAPAIDAAIDAPPPPPPPVASLDGVLTDGPQTPEGVAAMLAPKLAALATCLSGDGVARATEVSLVLVENASELRVAWQGGTPVFLPCLTELLGRPDTFEVEWNTTFSTAYAVIRTAPADVELPPAPRPPDRRADVQLLFCDLFRVSGADQGSTPREKADTAIRYGQSHVRHPRAIHLTLEASHWHPAEMKDKLRAAIRAEGIKRCTEQRW